MVTVGSPRRNISSHRPLKQRPICGRSFLSQLWMSSHCWAVSSRATAAKTSTRRPSAAAAAAGPGISSPRLMPRSTSPSPSAPAQFSVEFSWWRCIHEFVDICLAQASRILSNTGRKGTEHVVSHTDGWTWTELRRVCEQDNKKHVCLTTRPWWFLSHLAHAWVANLFDRCICNCSIALSNLLTTALSSTWTSQPRCCTSGNIQINLLKIFWCHWRNAEEPGTCTQTCRRCSTLMIPRARGILRRVAKFKPFIYPSCVEWPPTVLMAAATGL